MTVLQPTPLYEWPGLSSLLGCRFYLKHENHQPTGAFKVRGGVNLVATLSEAERQAGILGCSTGNHGQSLAFAARRFGVRCTIVVPRGNNPDKNRAIRNFGAELIEHGRDFDEAREYLETVLAPRGGRYVHSADEPKLIAGVGTMAWEIFETLPEPDVILVPDRIGERRLRHGDRRAGSPAANRDHRRAGRGCRFGRAFVAVGVVPGNGRSPDLGRGNGHPPPRPNDARHHAAGDG